MSSGLKETILTLNGVIQTVNIVMTAATSSSTSVPTAVTSTSSLSSSPESTSNSAASSTSSSSSSFTPSVLDTFTPLSISESSTANHGPYTSSNSSSSVSMTTPVESRITTSEASPSSAATSTTGLAAPGQTISHSKSSPSWLTTATFAGVVAGSFVVGALVAGLFVFALLRRRSKRSQNVSQSGYVPHHDDAFSGEKASAMSTVTTLAEPNFLPQQKEDAEVGRRILSLTDEIDQHVENFYRNAKVNVDETVEAKIIPYETRQMPNPLASCFESATYPLVLIRHCLAFHVFSQTVAPGEDTELILPAEIAGMVNSLYHRCLSTATPRDTISAFSLWKNLTGYLRPDLGSKTTSTRATSDVAKQFATQFSMAFSPWSDPQYTEEHRVNHLAGLVDHAIETGTWLFQQPEGYKFNWNTLSHSGRNSTTRMMMRETVVVPGVSKMTHLGALRNGQGQTVVQTVVKPF